MLIGYVSDENYAALADVSLEFTSSNGSSWETHSRASGSAVMTTAAAPSAIGHRLPSCGGCLFLSSRQRRGRYSGFTDRSAE